MAEASVPLVAILGPTAAGKTGLAARAAAAIGGEVISADSRQVYRRMDVGTGKDLADYVVDGRRVPVHLIDIVDPGYEYNVYEFKRDCVAAIREIHSRRRRPLLCGGTGLYLSAILQDYQLLAVPPDARRHQELEAMTTEQLISELKSSSALHNTTDTLDRSRLIRAVEIAEASPDERIDSLPLETTIFGLRWNRKALRTRITRRLTQRLDEGLVEEVERLLADGLSRDQLVFYGLEYRWVTERLCGEISREEMISGLERAIHQFAKRQETWFRRMERQGVVIHWLPGVDGTESNLKNILTILNV